MNKVYLLLGSNLDDPEQQLNKAAHYIEALIGPIQKSSNIYQTAAWGETNQPDFLNQVLIVKTNLSPGDTLKIIFEIERSAGRMRTVKNAPRIIDIDILFYNNEIIDLQELIVPHPQIQFRRFVLIPLNEISPQLIHPVLKKTVAELLNMCTDTLDVKRL